MSKASPALVNCATHFPDDAQADSLNLWKPSSSNEVGPQSNQHFLSKRRLRMRMVIRQKWYWSLIIIIWSASSGSLSATRGGGGGGRGRGGSSSPKIFWLFTYHR